MSVDLEDYFCDLPFNTWNQYPSRILETTEILLELFQKYNVTATFFTLGYVAEKFPELIKKIVSQGHEIASHTFSHPDLRKIDLATVEDDIQKSIKILEDVSGQKILGFRSPFFSLSNDNRKVINILEKYFKYDSSIFPIKTPLYGVPNAPTQPYQISSEDVSINSKGNLLEIPPAIMHFPLYGNLGIAGGFHLRFLPLFLIKYGIRKLNRQGHPAMCYIHPKDLDPNFPRIKDYGWYYYYGLKNAKQKFESLLKEFEFTSVKNLYSL